MTEKDYKELNKYLNEIFLYLDKNYKFILDDMLDIFILNDEYIKLLKDYDFSYDNKENNLTYMDVLGCARKIIESIDKEYLPLFDDLIDSGKLDFSYNDEYYDSNFCHDKNIDLININRNFNYKDVRTLIHEFFHYTNGRYGRNFNNDILTEFFSIYFETYTIQYLIEKGISKEEIDYKSRLYWTYNRANDLYYLETPFLAYNKFGHINSDSFPLLNQFFMKTLTEKQFDNECKYLLKWFKHIEKNSNLEEDKNIKQEEKFGEIIADYFRYFFGTMWAFYAIENCDMKDIVFANDHLNDENMTIEKIMDIMKIDPYDFETYKKALESINNYINKLEIKKVIR